MKQTTHHKQKQTGGKHWGKPTSGWLLTICIYRMCLKYLGRQMQISQWFRKKKIK